MYCTVIGHNAISTCVQGVEDLGVYHKLKRHDAYPFLSVLVSSVTTTKSIANWYMVNASSACLG